MEAPDELTAEQVKLGKKLARQRKVLNAVWSRLWLVRTLLVVVGVAWIFALPYPALWKHEFVDEHALQPAQVVTYYDWINVQRADAYLDQLEKLRDANATWEDRSAHLLREFRAEGLPAGNTSQAVWARVSPPRSEGTEAIIVSANWISRDGGPNLRGVASLLSLGDFLRGQNHWAFDFLLVVGDGYLAGLENFMNEYNPRANIWTGLNIDYPGHSCSHVGFFYEGINGRLPNQDVLNMASRTARYSGGITPAIHAIPPGLPASYETGAKHLLEHFRFAALGRPSAAHGLLAKHRIDAITVYCAPATGPHGFHSLGKMVESTLRSFNNQLERLHASFFFYLKPTPDHFLPVGHYLPAAVLLGASLTLGGFDCPDPLSGALWFLPALLLGALGWAVQSPLVSVAAWILPTPSGDSRKSLISLSRLAYGALIPVLAMVNFPQAILLAAVSLVALAPLPRYIKVALVPLHPQLLALAGIDLRAEWEMFGNVAWPALFAVWGPLAAVSAMT